MHCIGLVGGVSWVSTMEYYRRLNCRINQKKGKNHSAKILMYSFDFEEILEFQKNKNEIMELKVLEEKVRLLDKAGSDVIAICSNTTNKLADQLDSTLHEKLINLIDVTGDYLLKNNAVRVGLLGTRYTMELDFYKNKLNEKGVYVVVPDKKDREQLHHIIYEELCKGQKNAYSKKSLLNIINKMVSLNELDGIILGCTELPLLVSQLDVMIPLFDTIDIHIDAILKRITQIN
ncbi:MAG: amino acid racemase [Legionella longbeachae]|nr:amino acid racemase [Legionella longbeachae]